MMELLLLLGVGGGVYWAATEALGWVLDRERAAAEGRSWLRIDD